MRRPWCVCVYTSSLRPFVEILRLSTICLSQEEWKHLYLDWQSVPYCGLCRRYNLSTLPIPFLFPFSLICVWVRESAWVCICVGRGERNQLHDMLKWLHRKIMLSFPTLRCPGALLQRAGKQTREENLILNCTSPSSARWIFSFVSLKKKK